MSDWFTDKKDGKVQINSIEIYQDLHPEISSNLLAGVPADQVVASIVESTKGAYLGQYGKEPTIGALNNCKGRWNEFVATSFFVEVAAEQSVRIGVPVAIFSLPDSKVATGGSGQLSSKFLSLFEDREFVSGALSKVGDYRSRMFLPSPDFVVATPDEKRLGITLQDLMHQLSKRPEDSIVFDTFKGKLKASEVKAVASLKTSNRPDRRYQPSFEAAMIKAIAHITSQEWKYFMVTSESTKSDEILFDTAISPHGVALGKYHKLVDDTYKFASKADLSQMVYDALYSESDA